jgi:hypothetical protein
LTTPVVERYGSLSATGVAREAAFGQTTTPAYFVPDTDMTMESDPGLFFPQVMMGVRDVNVFPLYGTRKNAGDIGAPFFPTSAMPLFVASIGADGGDYTSYIGGTTGYGVTGVYTTGASTTLSAAVTQGAVVLNTTVSSTTVTISSGTLSGSAVPVVNFAGQISVPASTTITGTTISNAATATGQALAGINTITVASATGINTGSYIQIDTNVVGTSTSEVRKVTNVATNTLTLDTPLYFTHANSAVVKVVSAPFTHTVLQGNTLPSLTVEKNIGGYQSLQFTGTKIDKFTLKAEASDTELTMTSSVIAKTYNILDNPSAVSVINELPYVFAEANLTLNFGYGSPVQVAQVSNISMDIENGLKPTYTFNNSHDLQFLTPVTRHISGQFDVVFTSLDDVTWGYFNIMENQVQGSLSLTFTHPTGTVPNPNPSAGYSLTITLPAVNLSKYADSLKLDDVVMTTLNYEAAYALSATPPSTINVTITDGRWLPF